MQKISHGARRDLLNNITLTFDDLLDYYRL